jgi:hypothetical protein
MRVGSLQRPSYIITTSPPELIGTSGHLRAPDANGKGSGIGHSLFCLSDFSPSHKSRQKSSLRRFLKATRTGTGQVRFWGCGP